MRKLHIGGKVRREGWEVFDAIARPEVDHVGDAQDLSRFGDGIFDEIYASHVLEHFDYYDQLLAVLKEWRRVLVPNGRLYLSVPDMDVLASLFLDKENNTAEERFQIMRMMFGGHMDKYDFHAVGLNEDFLVSYLVHAGFTDIYKVKDLGVFTDGSGLKFKGVPISLNVVAEK